MKATIDLVRRWDAVIAAEVAVTRLADYELQCYLLWYRNLKGNFETLLNLFLELLA